MNLENGRFKLMRTVFGSSGSLQVFLGTKMGAASGNDLTDEGMKKLIEEAKATADSASEDPCHDFAPDQGKDVFHQGVQKPDMDRFLSRIQELLETVARDYPQVRIMEAIGSCDSWNVLSRNTNGTEFETFTGLYSFMLGICASDGERTTGMDYTGFCTANLDRPFLEMGDVRQHLEDIQKSIHPETLTGKFEGVAILTPSCAGEFLSMLLSNYIRDGVIIDGTSQWLNRVGEQVADEKLTVSLKPSDVRIVLGEKATSDGFRAEDVTLIENGTLKTHWLGLYAANKTGRPVVKNTGFDLVVEPGTQSLSELIASVDRGLILGGFSGGQPGTNGEFSGVAKNSFLIENGKIKGAITETMVNGNLGEALSHIRGLSKELVCDGQSVLPYIALEGIVISGK